MVSVVCCRRSDFWHCWFSVWRPLLLRTVCRGIAWRATGWAAVPTITPWPYSPLSSVSLVCCHSADIALYWKTKTKRKNIKFTGNLSKLRSTAVLQCFSEWRGRQLFCRHWPVHEMIGLHSFPLNDYTFIVSRKYQNRNLLSYRWQNNVDFH